MPDPVLGPVHRRAPQEEEIPRARAETADNRHHPPADSRQELGEPLLRELERAQVPELERARERHRREEPIQPEHCLALPQVQPPEVVPPWPSLSLLGLVRDPVPRRHALP